MGISRLCSKTNRKNSVGNLHQDFHLCWKFSSCLFLCHSQFLLVLKNLRKINKPENFLQCLTILSNAPSIAPCSFSPYLLSFLIFDFVFKQKLRSLLSTFSKRDSIKWCQFLFWISLRVTLSSDILLCCIETVGRPF